jgi:hypothetical protein
VVWETSVLKLRMVIGGRHRTLLGLSDRLVVQERATKEEEPPAEGRSDRRWVSPHLPYSESINHFGKERPSAKEGRNDQGTRSSRNSGHFEILNGYWKIGVGGLEKR